MRAKQKIKMPSVATSKRKIEKSYRTFRTDDDVTDIKLAFAECDQDPKIIYGTIAAGIDGAASGKTRRSVGVSDSHGLKPRARSGVRAG